MRTGAARSLVGVLVLAGTGCNIDSLSGDRDPVVYYYSLSYSAPEGRLFVGGDGGVMVFDEATGAKVRTIDTGTGFSAIVRRAGEVMAAAHLQDLWLFDPAGRRTLSLRHPDQVYSMTLSRDGAVVVSGDIDGRVRRYRTADGTEILPEVGPRSRDFVNDVAVSPDGAYAASAGVEGVRLWRMADGTPVRDWPGWSHRLAFTPDGRQLAVVTDLQVDVYDVANGDKLRSYDVGGVVVRMAYSSDGSRLALSAENNLVIKVFDGATGTELVTMFDNSPLRSPEQPVRDVSEMAFVGQDQRLAVAWRGGRLSEWRVDDGTLVFSRIDSDP